MPRHNILRPTFFMASVLLFIAYEGELHVINTF